MSAPTVVAGSVLGLVIAVLYGYIGLQQARRATTSGLGPAAFAIFWYGIGVHAAIESIWAIAVVLGSTSLSLGVFVLLVKIATGVAAIGGLVVYLLIIYVGNVRVVVGAALAYSCLLSLMTYEYLARVPVAVELRTWYAGLAYLRPEGLSHDLVAFVLFFPPLVATVGYMRLLKITTAPAQRRRILFTGASLAIFFAGFLLGWVHERWFWWGLIERALALVAAAGVLWTSQPSPRHEPAPQAS